MGLISAAVASVTSEFRDQWKEYFYCDALDAHTIAVKARKKTQGLFNNSGNNNVISNGSVINVADGQCMIIVENGQVADICAEPGEYRYDNTVAPSVLTGDFGESLGKVFADIGKRFSFGGQPASDQRVYYFNTKEITGNKYGTPNPVPFRVVDERAGIDIDISVRCFGEYSFRVTDPITFYTNNAGNFRDVYTVDMLASQMKTELLTALQPAFAKVSALGIRYSALPAHTAELSEALQTELNEKWTKQRGISIVSVGVSSVSASEEDEQMLKNMQKDAAYLNKNLAAATLVGAQADAMRSAAKNSAGAAAGFVGLNMAQSAGGINAAGLYTDEPVKPASGSWICPSCRTSNTGKFCSNCGTAKPGAAKWYCPSCGHENTGNFCSDCGTKKPE